MTGALLRIDLAMHTSDIPCRRIVEGGELVIGAWRAHDAEYTSIANLYSILASLAVYHVKRRRRHGNKLQVWLR